MGVWNGRSQFVVGAMRRSNPVFFVEAVRIASLALAMTG